METQSKPAAQATRIEQGLLVSCLDSPDLFDAIRTAHEIGYLHCEISVCLDDKRPNLVDLTPEQRKQVRSLVDDLGMSISALQCHMHNGYGDEGPAVRQRAVDHTKAMIDLAAFMGIDILHTVAGIAEDAASDEEKLDRVASSYQQILSVVGPDSPRVAMEPVFLYVVATLEHTNSLFDRLGDCLLQINFDPSHFPFRHESPIPFLRHYASRIIHAHSKDATITQGAPPPGADQDPQYPVYATPDGCHGFSFSAPGQGILDWDEIINELNACGFHGVLSLEMGHGYRGKPRQIASDVYQFFQNNYRLR